MLHIQNPVDFSLKVFFCAPTWCLAQEDPAVLARVLLWIALPEYLPQLRVESGLTVLMEIDPLEYLVVDPLPHLLVVVEVAVALLPPPLY